MRKTASAIVAVVALLRATAGVAHDFTVGSLVIDHPWARPTTATVATGAAYMTIINTGGAADTLQGAATPRAERVEIHLTETKDGISRMLPVLDGIVIAAGEQVAIQPGGYHLMLVGLTEPLRRDEKVPLILDFAEAGSVTVELAIQMRPPAPTDDTVDHSSH